MIIRRALRAVLRSAATLLVTFAASALLAAEPVDFESRIAPILITRCLECHSDANSSGGLILSRAETALRGGDSGEVLLPGDAEGSSLLERVKNGEMPPKKQGRSQKLPDDEIAALTEWISAGAKWPDKRKLDLYERTTQARAGRDWWSLQPVKRPDVPATNRARWSDNPIDAFIVSRLEKEGFEPAPQADRATLIRRVYFDLLGLPPSAAEIDAFVNSPVPDAYERLVARLLESPQYGERWARYWLDLVRFAETSGYERDQEKPFAWKYRDWVVKAINADMPYDRFITEQLAGDEIPARTEESVIATGFLRLGTWNDEPNDPQDYKYERLEDLVHVASTAFLATTVKCARCHDHKFDPIPQTDYYRIAAAFWPGPIEPRARELIGGPTKEELGFDVLGWTDVSRDPPPLHLLKKGELRTPGEVVEAGALSMIGSLDRPFAPPPADASTTHRRRQLAAWITDPHNPLTARVYVNRLWQQHFGHGLVSSPDNFGFTGQKPTHPELLDWLADEFMRGGWRARRMHYLMVTSRTYQQASVHPKQDEYVERDPGNLLWWRSERRRRDAEALRDAMLSVSGELDLRLGGPSFKPSISSEALEGLSRKTGAWQASPIADQRRRSLYMYSQRSLLPPMMTTFDLCDTTLPCGKRDISTVAPQALALLNGEFAHTQSQALARRVAATAGSDVAEQVTAAWRLALGRDPRPAERRMAQEHLERQLKNFERRQELVAIKPQAVSLPAESALHLRADAGVETDEQGHVIKWLDQSSKEHHAAQAVADERPRHVADAVHGLPAIRFDGKRRFLHVTGRVVSSQQFTVLAMVRDTGISGHREIFSNWNGSVGNAGTSLFLGTTAKSAIRFSDDFSGAADLVDPASFSLLTAVADEHDAAIYQNRQRLAAKGSPLVPRNLDTAYVVGQQGNIDGEFWVGDIAELLVYDRALSDSELKQAWDVLLTRYGLSAVPERLEPRLLALASLCHVLLNSNEFIYVD